MTGRRSLASLTVAGRAQGALQPLTPALAPTL